MSFISAVSGQIMRATQVNQFASWITGSKVDTDGNFTTTSATTYSLTVTNQDTGAGLIFKGVYGTVTAFTLNKTGATFTVPLVATNLTLFNTAGQIIYGSGGTNSSLLSPGTAFQEFVMSAGASGPTWATGLLRTVQAAGDLVYGAGANTVARLALGTNTTVLLGGATAPAWGQVADAQVSATAALTVSKFAAGTNGQFLLTTGGTVSWQSVTASATVDKIAEAVLTTAASQIVFTGVSTSYRHLRLVWQGRSDGTVASVTAFLQLNGDTGNNYDYQSFFGSATAAAASQSFTQPAFQVGLAAASSATANVFSSGTIDLPMYAGTVAQKSLVIVNSHKDSTAGGGMFQFNAAGFWRNTAAITQFKFFPSSGSWIAGTTLTLYGFPA